VLIIGCLEETRGLRRVIIARGLFKGQKERGAGRISLLRVALPTHGFGEE
jgi:hypothetical protein